MENNLDRIGGAEINMMSACDRKADPLDLGVVAVVARREILDWRDRHMIAASLGLNKACQDLRPAIDARLAAINWKQMLLERDSFIAREIDPVIAEAVNVATQKLIGDAQRELSSLIEHQLEVEGELGQRVSREDRQRVLADLAGSLAPMVGGIAVLAALPTIAVTTTAGIFGFFAVTTVSWPIALGGAAVAATAIATGAVKTSGLRDRGIVKARAKIDDHIRQLVFSLDPKQSAPSLLACVHGALAEAAETAIKRTMHDN